MTAPDDIARAKANHPSFARTSAVVPAAESEPADGDDASPDVSVGELSDTVDAINVLADRLRLLKGGSR